MDIFNQKQAYTFLKLLLTSEDFNRINSFSQHVIFEIKFPGKLNKHEQHESRSERRHSNYVDNSTTSATVVSES